MGQRPTGSASVTAPEEHQAGRTDPPHFMFQPLRIACLDGVLGEDGLCSKVLTIVAPVGYGKTVLMSVMLAELRQRGKQCVWFALDERDTPADALIDALEMLLHGSAPDLHPIDALFRAHETVERRVDGLLQRIHRYPLPVTLFIDNLHACSDPALRFLLDGLVFSTRPNVQLVLSSTRDIPLDLSRAQLHGVIRALTTSDLGFTSAEVGALLGPSLRQRLGNDGVEAVARRTEGWPAAVRMAQIILSNAADPVAALKDFSGSDEALAHLLNGQVLSGFPEAVREFLLCIAPLRAFSLDLCVHACGGEHARKHLAYLLERNVFIIPLDRNRQWYRLHGLFRDYLVHEAQRFLAPKRRRDVLVRAARWCDRHGHWRESMDYALASGSPAVACRILEQKAPVFVRDQGQLQHYIRWLETLHAQGRLAGPEAEYWFAWALAFHRRYDYARQQCTRLADRVRRQRRQGEDGQGDDLPRRIAILRTSIDSLSDRLQDAHRGALQWLVGVTAGHDDPFNVAIAHCIESCYYAGSLRFVEAQRAIEAAQEAAFQARSPHVDGWVATYAALIAIYAGDYAATYPGLVATLASARATLGDDSGICGTMAMVAAKCAAEMGLQEETWQLLEFGMRFSRTHGFLEAAACGLEAAVLLWSGRADDRVSLAMLDDVARSYPPRLSLMLSCYLIRRLTALGRVEEAWERAASIGLGMAVTEPALDIPARLAYLDALIETTRIDLLVGAGRFAQAEILIAEEMRRAKAVNRASRLVGLALVSAEIAVRSGQQTQAQRHVTRAIILAAKRGIVRPFNEHAETLAAVVADTKVSAWGFATPEEHRFFADRCRRLSFADASIHDRLQSLGREDVSRAETLTSREVELLGYLDAGFSNQQIADRVDVAPATIKWHLRNLYGKLGVSNRSAAVARARVLNRLPR